MKSAMKLILILTVTCALLIGGLFIGLIIPSTDHSNEDNPSLSPINTTIPGEKIQGYVGVFGNITIDSEYTPDSPATFPIYQGVQKDGDNFEYLLQNLGQIRDNVTSVADADQVARRIMEQYGGIPADAIFEGAETTYAEYINYTSDTVEWKKPVSTEVSYFQLVNDRGVIGERNRIRLELGENDELLYIHKVWRTYTYIGDVPIISLDTAIRKLQAGETLLTYVDEKQDVKITVMSIDYYAKNVGNNETLLEPVWSFYGITSSGNSVVLRVYARQFANFTATPTSGKTPLTVNFTDTSDTSPIQWLWNFGDGTNSTDQNPVHIYTTAGTYNVTLRAWNDLGSDTMEKPFLVTVRDPAAPVADFTGTPATGSAPLSVTFNDTSINAPTGWLWAFGDSTNATEQNPVHMYSTPGNYTVSLNVTNEDGTNSITKPDYITVTNLPPTTITTQPTTTATTTVTTTVTTTTTTATPTPTKTHAPLSPVVPVAGILIIGMFAALRRKKDR